MKKTELRRICYEPISRLEQDMHRPIDGFDLDKIFYYKEERVLQKTIICSKNKIIIHESLNGEISLFIRDLSFVSTRFWFDQLNHSRNFLLC
jgi:hypothetical protein